MGLNCGIVDSYVYNNFRVIQHNKDYNAWVTSSQNGWEYVGIDGGTFARIRR